MPARTLFKMATTKLVQNKEAIEDIGEIPYDKIKGVLAKLERPEQLHTIEENSPHILGQTSDLWRAFLRRDVQGYDRGPVEPKDGKSWYKVYRRALREAKERQAEQEVQLMAKFKEKQDERDRNLTTVSERSVVPGSDRRKRAAGTFHSRTGNPALLTFTAGSRTRTDSGKGIMRKIRRETADHALRRTVLAPQHQRIRPPQRPNTARPTERAGPQVQSSRSDQLNSNMGRSSVNSPGEQQAYRLPSRSANPMLAARQPPGSSSRPSVAGAAEAPVHSARPSPPPGVRPSPQKRVGGVFMPSAKKRKV